ncbi:MAG TPA: hypothetical protein ENJ80_03050 [Gammaproteobacteria bacterium]|nr:hypothetical protein [Gammaproteobacteria bacterium]
MEDIQIDLYGFLAALEVAFVLLVIALVFFIRSKSLAGRVQLLQRKLKKAQAQDAVEAVSFDQYLRDEVIRNQELIDSAAASDDDAEKKAAELLRMRNQFLELEIEVRSLENNPVKFQDRLAAGMSDLIEQLRPEPETVTEAVATADGQEAETEPGIEQDVVEERATIDTHDAEFNRLKDVINNQQDAMAALRRELEARETEIEDADSVMRKLDEFEKQSTELQQCLNVLEQENERLKALRAASGDSSGIDIAAADSGQLDGLKSMMGQQQETITNLQDMIRELAPEASKAKELQDSINAITRTSQELSGCVAVLEDENAMLRVELEQIQVQLEQQAEQQEAEEQAPEAEPGIALDDMPEAEPEAGDADAAKQELEIKVQELEALVEFKDAAIEELEKQYHSLETRYLAVTGEKNAD